MWGNTSNRGRPEALKRSIDVKLINDFLVLAKCK